MSIVYIIAEEYPKSREMLLLFWQPWRSFVNLTVKYMLKIFHTKHMSSLAIASKSSLNWEVLRTSTRRRNHGLWHYSHGSINGEGSAQHFIAHKYLGIHWLTNELELHLGAHGEKCSINGNEKRALHCMKWGFCLADVCICMYVWRYCWTLLRTCKY